MKRFLFIIVLILLVGCDSDPVTTELTSVDTIHLVWGSGSQFERLNVHRIKFDTEGHEMWLYYTNHDGIINIMHSPECKKCNTHIKEITEESKDTVSNYWGW